MKTAITPINVAKIKSPQDLVELKIANKIKSDFDVVKLDYKYLNRETGLTVL